MTATTRIIRFAVDAGAEPRKLVTALASHPGWIAGLVLAVLAGFLIAVFSLAWTGKQRAAMIQRLTAKSEGLENHLRTLLESTSDLVFLLDGAGNIVTWNPSAERVTGHHAGQAIRQNLSRFSPAGPQHQTQEWLKRVLAAKDSGRSNLPIVSSDGKALTLRVQARRMHRDGKRVEILCVAQAEKNYQQAGAGLDGTKDGASGSPGQRNHLISSVVEQLRRPASSIFAVAELLHQANLEPEIQECLEVLMVSSQGVLSALEDAGDIGKLEAEELVLDPGEFSLRGMLAESLQPLAASTMHEGRQLDWEVDPRAPDVYWGDARRLRQVVRRLASHLLDSSSTDGVRLTVHIDSMDQDEAQLSFTFASRKKQGTDRRPQLLPLPTGSFAAGRGGRDSAQEAEASLSPFRRLIELMGGSLDSCAGSTNNDAMCFRLRLKKVEHCGKTAANGFGRGTPRRRLARFGDGKQDGADARPVMIAGFKDQARANLSARLEDRGLAVEAVDEESEMLALLEKYNWGGFQMLALCQGGSPETANEIAEFIQQRALEAGNCIPILLVSPAGIQWSGNETTVVARLDGSMDEQRITEAIGDLCAKVV